MIVIRCESGDVGVMPVHEALSVVLDLGALRVYYDGMEYALAVFGDIAEIKDNTVIVLTTEVE